ncbi:MAG: ATP-dependent nuclease, subunit [Bryobacterales bacterium]|nr:ATP-dependent nuclease, subunit [Bryobacterales bacterium]
MAPDHAGSAGVHRVTLVQAAAELARSGMAERGLAPLSSLGREAVAARIAQKAQEQAELAYFHPVASLPGFARALARTILELRLAGVRREGLASAGLPAADLGRLLERYEAELQERSLVDLPGLLALATDAAKKAAKNAQWHPWVGLPLARLDADLESRAHREFFNSLAARAPEVLQAELGSPEQATGLEADPTGSLEHLRKFLFAQEPQRCEANDGRFEFFSAPGEGLEAVEIARRIIRLAREGVAFDQVAILLRNPERYQPMIEDALRRAQIPAWFSRGTARPHPAGRAFLALLLCAGDGLSASRFAEYLSLGQVPETPGAPKWVAPEDELLGSLESEAGAPSAEADRPTPRRWERLLVDAAVIGGKDRWERRLNGLEEEFALQEKPLDQLQNLKKFALPLIGMLDALPAAATWSVWLEQLAELARLSLRDPDPVLSVLAELAPMGDVGPVALDEVAEVLSERLRFLRREPPNQRWGRVFVGSIDEARGREFAVVFLPGLAEGLFPQRMLEDPLLLDELRQAVCEHLPLRKQRVNEERMRLHLAVAAARDRLVVSYPRMEVAEARPRVPSFYALELPRAVEGSLPELKAFENRAREAAPARLNWPAPKEAADAIDDAEYDLVTIAKGRGESGALHYLVGANPHLVRSLRGRGRRWRSKWRAEDGLVTDNAAALEALGAERLTARTWSPSSLENFAVCPYKFALHGIYRLKPRDESVPLEQLDPRTRGALFHEIQYELFQDLQRAGLLPVNDERLPEALKRADAMLDRVAAKYQEKLAPAIPRVWKSEVEDLRTDLRGWLQHVARNDDDWEPVEFELEFGKENPIALEEGISLRGKIDLLEKHVSREVYRVTDHKTGKRPDSIPRWVGGGRSLQPLLYGLAAEKLRGAPVESGRLLYATQRGGYTPIEIKLDERARQFLHKLLGDIDASIANGFLPPAPAKDACGICDYRIACGPYEERRHSKKDRHDARLDPLTEIRGMA